MLAVAIKAGAVGDFFNRLASLENRGGLRSCGFPRGCEDRPQGGPRFPIARLARNRFHRLHCLPMTSFRRIAGAPPKHKVNIVH